jgi:preprotein translocase subunit SecA
MSVGTLSLARHTGVIYPEQRLLRERWYESPARALAAGLARPVVGSSTGYRPIVRMSGAHAVTAAGLSAAALQRRAVALGQVLRVQGFRAEPVAELFALVREAAARTLGQRHYDVQLIGAWVLLHGRVSEMDTGEGKTLTATLAATAAALAGMPVHVITANDYLAQRDAAELEPLYAALGLSVGHPRHGMSAEQRRAAYARPVVYVSNKEIAFDFLRDRVQLGARHRRLGARLEHLAAVASPFSGLVLRGLCFALVDEADSVLVDEARTPLIISAPAADGDADGCYAQALALARALDTGRDFERLAQERRVELTEHGRRRLDTLCRDLDGIWRGPRRREQLIGQALAALHLYERDVHYLVRDDKVQIVDEYTGRILADRSWEQGLHQMVEAKEAVPVTGERKALARTSYQDFFRRYLHLCGMTGTARELAAELHAVYGLHVVRVPTHRPSRRRALRSRVFAMTAHKWRAVAAHVQAVHRSGRPVLVGTRSVAAADAASRALAELGVPHRVLSASQDRAEAEVIAAAGARGAVTVATNMAGRGTDIKLAGGVAQLGGLHVLATELHDARRIDRQLYGRCARQGDPGDHVAFVALDDALLTENVPGVGLDLLRRALRLPGGELLATRVLRLAQNRAERRHLQVRRRLLKNDERLADSLAFSGSEQ